VIFMSIEEHLKELVHKIGAWANKYSPFPKEIKTKKIKAIKRRLLKKI